MKEITLQEAALAWAQGKRVECLTVNQTEYMPISRVGTSDGIISPTCFGDLDEDRIQYKFRLAPEPPAKRYRPWTPEEVPVGAFTRPKVGGDMLMIIGRSDGALLAGDNGFYPLSALLNAREHSIDPIGTHDSKRTWLPCGVEVDA